MRDQKQIPITGHFDKIKNPAYLKFKRKMEILFRDVQAVRPVNRAKR
jgi:hypothetical protein